MNKLKKLFAKFATEYDKLPKWLKVIIYNTVAAYGALILNELSQLEANKWFVPIIGTAIAILNYLGIKGGSKQTK